MCVHALCCVCADPLVITDLIPYTSYSVRFAPRNHLGQGGFSDELTVRTQGIRECHPPLPPLSLLTPNRIISRQMQYSYY